METIEAIDTTVNKPIKKFYSDAEEYWSKIPATVDGMLGGFGHVSRIDIQGSKIFLQQLFKCKNPPGRMFAADCGAGIGRITKNLLLNYFEKVDLIEQNPVFLEKAKEYIGLKLLHKIGNFYPVGLQNFNPESNKYDVIWVQWVLGHLTDFDAKQFFELCKIALKPNGIIVVKENVTSSGSVEIDEQDSSVTRSLEAIKLLFIESHLECYRQLKQTSFPKQLYNVYMFALKPKAGTHLESTLTITSINVNEKESDSNCDKANLDKCDDKIVNVSVNQSNRDVPH